MNKINKLFTDNKDRKLLSLYFCAGSNREVLQNVYKESVLAQIKKLQLASLYGLQDIG